MNDELFLKIEQAIAESGEVHYDSGPASDQLISAYELSLGTSFPESYKIFLKKYGTLMFNGLSFYGISKQGLSADSAPDVRFVTIEARKLGDIDNNMIKILSSGYGPSFSIDTSTIGEAGEPVIVETELSFKRERNKNIVANNFAEFLLQEISESLE
ncbi:SMI1/KNR4 family protein [Escherichia coli]|uniref:SMI1/KNR4 family protein n=1 Tax=Escherichia sp. MOD1-EC7003 TaxID=2093900 RepID=UPI000CF7A3CA|nr:SMI1/KNR4 family protein [Escherichia sp. MOD1-EC7003]EGO8358851.1 SMI1/KNR4 family protein [Escherichia coli]EGO8377639.1 SMI1/KNR4 family protein [Escherichia coli]MCH0695728.1 SMI1/KNR4 family protein [Escherichia coli]